MTCCWAGLLRFLLPVNLENCRNLNSGDYPVNDWGVCQGCKHVVASMLKNHILPCSICADSLKKWCNGADLKETSTMKHIINWKLFGVYSPRIFIAMCDHGITPYMIEHFTMDMLKQHCLRMLEGKPEEWPFYRALADKGCVVQRDYALLKVRVIMEEASLSFDEHADSDHPDHIKRLTKFVRCGKI